MKKLPKDKEELQGTHQPFFVFQAPEFVACEYCFEISTCQKDEQEFCTIVLKHGFKVREYTDDGVNQQSKVGYPTALWFKTMTTWSQGNKPYYT
ncbi:hypothetical protein EMCRGX_G033539 [Ephydatia muelleri]